MAAQRVLVIEDEAPGHAWIATALEPLSDRYDCDRAADPVSLDALLAHQRFDCILLDSLSEHFDAAALLPRIHRQQPNAAVIVVSDGHDERAAIAMLKAGALDYLATDDLDANRLERAIHDATTLHEARRTAERADAAMREAASKLGFIAASTPRILAARRSEEIAAIAAATVLPLLEATGVRVVIDKDGVDHTRGEGQVPAGATDGTTHADGISARTRGLFARDGARIGAITAVGTTCEAAEDIRDNLLLQLCQIVSAALENAWLMREKETAIALREDVLAVVSHDLRGPLNNLALALGLLDQCEPRIRESLAYNVAHMARLVDDLIDLARIDNGRFELTRNRHALLGLCDRVLRSFAPQARTRGITLLIEPRHDPSIVCDAHRLAQVLSNLVSNALKFTPAGGTVRLGVHASEDGATLEVIDSGPGIKREDRSRIFGRYWSKDSRRAGLGLGLFIAKSIVDAHSGVIGCDDAPGGGARFWVTLPKAPE